MSIRVECPRCGRTHTARRGDSDVECNCHTYCPLGDKPSDCTLTSVSGDITMNWPRGVHGTRDDEYDDEHRVTDYCSVHDYYFSKAHILIPVDSAKRNLRARASLRYFGEGAQ